MALRSATPLSLTLRASSVLLLLVFSAVPARAADERRDAVAVVQMLIDELRVLLSIPSEVTASMVPKNPLLVSVAPAAGRPGAFALVFEDGFIDSLDDTELRAVIAHELGHVWIFTHHPYLQTEKLANDVAMRVVTRDSLRDVYGKVWERTGLKGDLGRFLGQ
jgi:hypothetical protein